MILAQDNSIVRPRRRMHLYMPLSLSTWVKRLHQEMSISGRRRRHRLYIKDPRHAGHSYYGESLRHVRLEQPLNTIHRYGVAVFVAEVRQLVQAEYQTRGYYPTMPEIYRIIAREFGADFAEQSRGLNLPAWFRLWGLCYSPRGAEEYEAQRQLPAQPLLDMNAPYRLPFETVGNYIRWKLLGLAVGDAFEVGGLVICRIENNCFWMTGRGVKRAIVIWGDWLPHAIARVLMMLRYGNAPKMEPAAAFLAPLVPIRSKSAPVTPAPAPDTGGLPALLYTTTAERMHLTQLYQAKGYSMAQIQAALVRADLAAKVGQDVQ